MNYYNDFDASCCAWIQGLIDADLIPPGVVDCRSISDIKPDDLKGFTQVHLFCGIAGWPLALQLAGWPSDKPVWTASCPCPPFSSAGKKKLCPQCHGKPIPHPLKTGIFACTPCGHEWLADDRHLYPELYRLMRDCGAPVTFGEQVSGADGLIWLAGVRATLEKLGRAVGAADLCAAGVKSPHMRQRLYWVADPDSTQCDRRERDRDQARRGGFADGGRMGNAVGSRLQGHAGDGDNRNEPERLDTNPPGPTAATGSLGGRVGHAGRERDERRRGIGHLGCEASEEQSQARQRERSRNADSDPSADNHGLANSNLIDGDGTGHGASDDCGELEGQEKLQGVGTDYGMEHADSDRCKQGQQAAEGARHRAPVEPANGWSDFRLILCRDGKHRRIPVESALFPLVDARQYALSGVARRGSVRPALLKGAGNAIVPETAAAFIRAYLGS